MALGVCRDCYTRIEDRQAARCGNCGSARLVRHPEIETLALAHIDCDAFYASIEKRDDPSLADKPTIVGGGRRGVVSTACYIARTYGVRSAMPMFKALQLCPQATVIRPKMAKYASVSREVQAIFETVTPLVEAVSLDEAYLDLTGTQALHHASPAFVLAKIARRIEDEIGITVSIGLSFNKLLAKLASELDKPRGFGIIGRAEARAFLAARPPRTLPGVGPKFALRLADDGFRSIGDIQKAGEKVLGARYGETGRWLAQIAVGRDDRKVEPEREAKTVSAETTFLQDLGQLADLEAELWPLAEEVAERLKRHHLVGRTIQLKLKTTDFRLLTRRVTLAAGTQLAETLYRAAQPLLAKEIAADRRRRFRLIGIGAAELAEPGGISAQNDLFAPATPASADDPKLAAVERAIDAVRGKFGNTAIRKGRGIGIGDGVRRGRDLPRSPR